MKKENVKVAVTDNQQAEIYGKVLAGLGCNISKYCFTHQKYEQFLTFDSKDEDWFLANAAHPTLNGKHIITFGQLVDLLTTKPLLISEDGVELFEGDKYWSANNICGDWVLSNYSKSDKKEYVLSYNSVPITTPDNHKAFSTKQAALDWIEKMNKPKEIKIDFSGCTTANVSKNAVKLDWIGGCISLGNDEIKQIMDAFDKLK